MVSPFLSLRGRVLINVEALNMTESVGNYVKHRRVPVVLPEAGNTTFFVPAISGESIAHGYQLILAQTAIKRELPVCNICRKGIFLKSTNKSVFISQFRDKLQGKELNDSSEFEKFVVANCIVEDIGGFLYAPANQRGQQEIFEKPEEDRVLSKKITSENVKRTSNFFTGYMVPVRESLRSAIIEPQLHSRYALGTPFVKSERGAPRARGQMIYNVELSSAIYSFSFDLDTRFIGRTTYYYSNIGEKVVEDQNGRVETSLEAFEKFMRELMFGAKKTRFLPVVDWESMLISVSNDVWTVPSPFTIKYLSRSLRKAERFKPENLKLFAYVNQDLISKISRGEVGVEVLTKELLQKVKEELDKKKKEIIEVFSEQKEVVESKFSELTQEVLKDLIEREVRRLVEEKVSRELGYEELVDELKSFLDKAEKKSELIKVFDNPEEAVAEAVKYAIELQGKN